MKELLLNEAMRMAVAIMLIYYATILVACVADTIDAIKTARSIGRPVESAKLRNALAKVCKYMLYLTPFVMLDIVIILMTWTKLPYISGVITLSIIVIEIKSMTEHARCRKDKVAKVPSSLHDLIEFFGEDALKDIILDIGKRKLNEI